MKRIIPKYIKNCDECGKVFDERELVVRIKMKAFKFNFCSINCLKKTDFINLIHKKMNEME